MPAQPAWFHRLEEIFTAPRAMTSTRLDRAAVEKLFRERRSTEGIDRNSQRHLEAGSGAAQTVFSQVCHATMPSPALRPIASTRVNAEQASKSALRKPTRR